MGLTEHPPADAAARSPFMHRTKSVDYAIVLDGEIDMLLDEFGGSSRAPAMFWSSAAPIMPGSIAGRSGAGSPLC